MSTRFFNLFLFFCYVTNVENAHYTLLDTSSKAFLPFTAMHYGHNRALIQ